MLRTRSTRIPLRRLGSGGAPATALLCALTFLGGAAVTGALGDRSNPSATQVTLAEVGASPGAISLQWTRSLDSAFTEYAVKFSATSSNGPWQVLANITVESDTSAYFYGLTPGATGYWEVQDEDSFGSAVSNTLEFAQPDLASVRLTQPTTSSAELTWTNFARYGGMVAFGSYNVLESVNGSAYASIATLTSVSASSYLVPTIEGGVNYSFELETIDSCGSCSPVKSSYSNSTPLTVHDPPAPAKTTAASALAPWIPVVAIAIVIGVAVVVLVAILASRRPKSPPENPGG